MKTITRLVASTRLTMAGFALLAAGILATYNLPGSAMGIVVAPLALLAVNLCAAMLVHPRLRRGGLGVFHAALLVMILLAGCGRLTHLDGRLEVTEGTVAGPEQLQVTASGPLHGTGWQKIAFLQGRYEVNYAPRLKRGRTHSEVWLEGEAAPRIVGDDTPLVLDGYRLYTTFNKGFAPLLTWQPAQGEATQAALHLPSYPLFDYQQTQDWTPPGASKLRLWLRIEQPLQADAAWTLRPADMSATLIVEADGRRHELKPGDAVQLAGALLKYERLLGWMGYRVFYDPTLPWLLVVSLAGVLGLAWHLWGRAVRLLPMKWGVAA
jgi:hypothetical protein